MPESTANPPDLHETVRAVARQMGLGEGIHDPAFRLAIHDPPLLMLRDQSEAAHAAQQPEQLDRMEEIVHGSALAYRAVVAFAKQAFDALGRPYPDWLAFFDRLDQAIAQNFGQAPAAQAPMPPGQAPAGGQQSQQSPQSQQQSGQQSPQAQPPQQAPVPGQQAAPQGQQAPAQAQQAPQSGQQAAAGAEGPR